MHPTHPVLLSLAIASLCAGAAHARVQYRDATLGEPMALRVRGVVQIRMMLIEREIASQAARARPFTEGLTTNVSLSSVFGADSAFRLTRVRSPG